jgi:hypothetical protein
MKSKEALTMKTLETKLLITEKKKEVKLAKVEARREDAKLKAELDLRMTCGTTLWLCSRLTTQDFCNTKTHTFVYIRLLVTSLTSPRCIFRRTRMYFLY